MLELAMRGDTALMNSVVTTDDWQAKLARRTLRAFHMGELDDIAGNVPENFRLFPGLKQSEEDVLDVFKEVCDDPDFARRMSQLGDV